MQCAECTLWGGSVHCGRGLLGHAAGPGVRDRRGEVLGVVVKLCGFESMNRTAQTAACDASCVICFAGGRMLGMGSSPCGCRRVRGNVAWRACVLGLWSVVRGVYTSSRATESVDVRVDCVG